MKNVCKKCGSDNVIRERCLNCGQSYPYTDLSMSKGSTLILIGLPCAAVLFIAVKNSVGNELYSAVGDDTMIIFGSLILAIWILIKRQAKGKL